MFVSNIAIHCLNLFSRLRSRFRSCHPYATAGFGCGCPSRSPCISDRGANMASFHHLSFCPFRSAGRCWLPTFCSLLPFLKAAVVGQLGDCWHNIFSFFSRHFFDNKLRSLHQNDPQKRLPHGKLQNLFREDDTVGQLTWGGWWYQSGFVGGRNVAPMGWQPGTFAL